MKVRYLIEVEFKFKKNDRVSSKDSWSVREEEKAARVVERFKNDDKIHLISASYRQVSYGPDAIVN